MYSEHKLLIQRSVEFTKPVNEIADYIKSEIISENDVIITVYRMNDQNCSFKIMHCDGESGGAPSTKYSLSPWPYNIIIELKGNVVTMSIYNEFEGVAHYELCQHMVLFMKRLAKYIAR